MDHEKHSNKIWIQTNLNIITNYLPPPCKSVAIRQDTEIHSSMKKWRGKKTLLYKLNFTQKQIEIEIQIAFLSAR